MSHKISSATATAATPPSAATATQITLQPKLPPTYCYFRGGGSKNIQLLLWLLQHNDDILQLLKIGYSKAIERLASVVYVFIYKRIGVCKQTQCLCTKNPSSFLSLNICPLLCVHCRKSAPETLIVTSDPKNWLAPMVPVAGWNASCTVRQDLMISVKAHESLAMVKQMLMVMLNEKIPEIPLGSPAKLYRHRSILWDQLISDAEGHTPSGSSCVRFSFFISIATWTDLAHRFVSISFALGQSVLCV